jgi:mono/diheme cytochrome c family protein
MKSFRLMLALGAMALPAVALAQSAAPSGDVAHGKQLYAADGCYECHGRAGQGSRATGPRLARTEMPYAAFAQQIRKPSDVMPPYTTVVMSDKDVADVYAFLKSLPEPPNLADIPILQH